MKAGMYVYCTTQFEHFHRWQEAPLEVSFLRTLHRHIFHVKVVVKVDSDNRGVEFISLKRTLDNGIDSVKQSWSEKSSCEDMCRKIKGLIEERLPVAVSSVEVSEDGENGALIIC